MSTKRWSFYSNNSITGVTNMSSVTGYQNMLNTRFLTKAYLWLIGTKWNTFNYLKTNKNDSYLINSYLRNKYEITSMSRGPTYWRVSGPPLLFKIWQNSKSLDMDLHYHRKVMVGGWSHWGAGHNSRQTYMSVRNYVRLCALSNYKVRFENIWTNIFKCRCHMTLFYPLPRSL